MRITRVYTGVGDKGQTRLVGGREIAKDDARIEAYGTLDELNSVLGLTRAFLSEAEGEPSQKNRLEETLQSIQNDLFNVGSELATKPADFWPGMIRVEEADHRRLEALIDGYNDELEPLKEFILPGGGKVAATLHQARTVCRRAERRVVTLFRHEPEAASAALIYLNRLSDLLFVIARWSSKLTGEPELFWQKPTP